MTSISLICGGMLRICTTFEGCDFCILTFLASGRLLVQPALLLALSTTKSACC